MASIRALLVDDEPLANAGLRALLASHDDVEVVGEALSGREAVQKILSLAPDLVFLDIQMPKVDGFDVIETVMRRKAPGARMPAVVFVTAYDEFAVRAFEVRALDYLLKPVDESRFRAALQRAREAAATPLTRDATLERRLRALLDDYATPRDPGGERYLARMTVSIGSRTVLVDVKDIEWIGARDYCAVLHTAGKTYVVRETLTALEDQLDPSIFARVHRSAIVNLTRVTELKRRAVRGASLLLTDGTTLPVSRSRRGRLIELLRSRR